MYKNRLWSAKNSKYLNTVYELLQTLLFLLHPLFKLIGYQRLDKVSLYVEKPIKKLLFDSQSCGQCILGSTGMSCPMNCPKSLRNGPCGGVRSNGNCEIEPDMPCVWVVAWQGNKQLAKKEFPIQVVQPPVDIRLKNTSAWLREVRKHFNHAEINSDI